MGGGVSSISAADDRAGKNSPEFVFAFQVLRQENEMGVKLNWNGVGKKDRDRDVFEHLKDTFIKAKVKNGVRHSMSLLIPESEIISYS
jgi:hypothetical protein